MQHVFCNHGFPLEAISDRRPQFAGNYTRALADRLRITWNMSTAFHSMVRLKGQVALSRTCSGTLCPLPCLTGTSFSSMPSLQSTMLGRNLCKIHPLTSTMGVIPGYPWELPLGAHYQHRVRTLPQQRLLCKCRPHLLAQKLACLLHSSGKKTTMTKGMRLARLQLDQMCYWPLPICTSKLLAHASSYPDG